jgi:hypothetical protein
MTIDLAAAVLGGERQNAFIEATVGPLGQTVDPERLPVAASVRLDPLDVGAVARAVPAVKAQLPPELEIDGPLRFEARVSGTASALQVSGVTLDAGAATVGYGPGFTKPAGVPFLLTLDASQANGKLEIAAAALRLADAAVKAKGSVDTAAGALDIQLDLARTTLEGWERILPALAGYQLAGTLAAQIRTSGTLEPGTVPRATGSVELRDVGVRGKDLPTVEGISSTVALEGDSAVIPATAFRVGGSALEVEGTVERFGAPVIRFALRSPELRLASLGGASDGPAANDALRQLAVTGVLATGGPTPAFQGSVRSPAGALQAIAYEDLQADLKLENDVATLEKLAVKLAGGSASGSGRYDMRNADQPSFDVTSALRAVALTPLLGPHFPGAADVLEGRLDADLTLTGAGETWEVIQRRLKGNGRADIKDGKLKGINVAESVLGGATGIAGLSVLAPAKVQKKFPALFGTEDTVFEQCGGSVRIGDGRVATDDLLLRARDYDVRGRGWFSFENQVDFTATLVASQALSTEVIGEVAPTKFLANPAGRLEIPFRFAGVLPKVRPQPDASVLARVVEGALVGEGLDRLLGGGKGKGKGTAGAGGAGAAGQAPAGGGATAGGQAPAAGGGGAAEAGQPKAPPTLGDVLQGVLGAPKEPAAPKKQGKKGQGGKGGKARTGQQ